MSTKSRLRIKPPHVGGRRQALTFTMIGPTLHRAARTKLPLFGTHWRNHARTGVPAGVSALTRVPAQPARERGAWSAFGLAVALHALLAALVLSDMQWPRSNPSSARAVVAGQLVAPPLASPAPRLPDQSTGAVVTGEATRLAADHEHASFAPRHILFRRIRARLAMSPPVHTLAAQRAHMAGVKKVEQQVDESADREYETRLAALQTMAAASVWGQGLTNGDSGTAVSPGYVDKVARRVRANVVAPFAVEGNPSAVIAVKCAPSGALLGVTMQRSSGNPQWDSATLSAVEKSAPMPRDVNGSTPASFLITFQPMG